MRSDDYASNGLLNVLKDDNSISFAEWLGFRVDGFVAAVVIPLVMTAVLFAGSILANILRILNVSRQFHRDGLWFAIKNSALVYSVTHDQLPSLRNYVLVGRCGARKRKTRWLMQLAVCNVQ